MLATFTRFLLCQMVVGSGGFNMSWYLHQLLLSVHLFSSSAWFGALVYRTFFVDRKANQFLGGGSVFEHFSLHLSHRMRYVLLLALATCGGSGAGLMSLRWSPEQSGWQFFMISKIILWVVAFAIFIYISWVFWPRRVFATPDEFPGFRRRGFVLSIAMLSVVGLSFVLGQLSRQ
jgi:putative copper export protein